MVLDKATRILSLMSNLDFVLIFVHCIKTILAQICSGECNKKLHCSGYSGWISLRQRKHQFDIKFSFENRSGAISFDLKSINSSLTVLEISIVF